MFAGSRGLGIPREGLQVARASWQGDQVVVEELLVGALGREGGKLWVK